MKRETKEASKFGAGALEQGTRLLQPGIVDELTSCFLLGSHRGSASHIPEVSVKGDSSLSYGGNDGVDLGLYTEFPPACRFPVHVLLGACT